MAETYAVFISDGNRLSNADHKTDLVLGEVLKARSYDRLIGGSIRVNGVKVPDGMLNATLDDIQRATLAAVGKPYTTYMKVQCRTQADGPSKKREKPVRREQDGEADGSDHGKTP